MSEDQMKDRVVNVATAIVMLGLALVVLAVLAGVAVRLYEWIS